MSIFWTIVIIYVILRLFSKKEVKLESVTPKTVASIKEAKTTPASVPTVENKDVEKSKEKIIESVDKTLSDVDNNIMKAKRVYAPLRGKRL